MMTESLLGISAALPTLGSGKAEEFGGDELLEDLDVDIDQLNEQTFGDAAIEEDWEEQHEKLAGNLKSCHDDDHNGGGFFDSGPNYKTTQDDLEQSISQMMVEDDEVDSRYKHGQPIPKGRPVPDVDSLFGPASPPGLLNTEELVGGHQNIWGSPARDNHIPKQEDGLKSLLKVLQTPKSGSVSQHFQDPSIVTAVKAMSTSLPNARTLADIESDANRRRTEFTPQPPPHGNMPIPGSQGKMHTPKPMVRTLEEIEQEMTGHVPRKIPSPPQPGFPFPIGTPPQAQGFINAHHNKSVPMPIPGGIPGKGRGHIPSVPPPMPTPGHLSNPNAVPHPHPHSHPPPSHSIGSPGMGIQILQRRTTPPPGLRNTPPMGVGMHGGHPPPQRTSPVFMVNQHRPEGNHGDTAGSPITPRPTLPPQLPSDRPLSPLEGTPFMPHTPQPPLRMPSGPIQSDPTHLRGQRGGHQFPGPGPFLNQAQGIKQALFAGIRNGSSQEYHHRSHDDHNQDDYHGYHPRNDMNHRGRDDFHHHRGRGDFMHRGRGDMGHHGGRGDHHDNHYHHRGPDDFNHRGGDFGHNQNHNHWGRDEMNARGRDDYHSRYRGQGPQGPRGHPYQGHDNYRNRPRYNSYGDELETEEETPTNKDEFAGLMTKKEKDWVIKIQLLQLQTENPYLDDYYYTSWAMKRMLKERELAERKKGNKAEPKLVIPHLARMETKGYKPVQFENSLGRISASSVHNPRQIIDIKRTPSTEHEDAKAREVRKFKELLLDVEKGYDLLLDVDDLEKKALGLPEDIRPPLFVERSRKIHTLHDIVQHRADGEEGLLDFLLIRKGVKLVCRLLPLLTKVEVLVLLKCILHHLTAISKKDWQKDVLPAIYDHLACAIHLSNFEELVGLTQALQGGSVTLENNTNTILTALQNNFGSSVIWCMVSHGETIYSTVSPVDMDLSHQQDWSQFVTLVASTLNDLTKDNLTVPQHSYPKVSDHVRRILDKRTFLTVEDKLQLMVVPPVS